MIRTNLEKYENYGKVINITDGVCEAKVTLDLGPRVIYFARVGKKNMFFNDLQRKTNCEKPEMDAYYGKGRYWYLYGGYRLWLSPEALPETYYPDNDPVDYVTDGDKVTFIPKMQKENGLQFSYSLHFLGNGTVKIKNVIKNLSENTVRGAAWSLCVMNKNSFTYAYQNDADTGLLPNRTVVLWPYTKIDDHRLRITDRVIAVRQDPSSDRALKVGFNNTSGRIMTYLDGELFTQTYNTCHGICDYPDGGCSCEIYSCPDFTEAETISPLETLFPGAHMEFELEWHIEKAPVCINGIEDI